MVSQVCDLNSTTDVLPPVAETVMLCDTAGPPASAEKVNDDVLTDIVWALAAPAASNTREIRAGFNVFKESLHSIGYWGERDAPALSGARIVPQYHVLTKNMNRLVYMSRTNSNLCPAG